MYFFDIRFFDMVHGGQQAGLFFEKYRTHKKYFHYSPLGILSPFKVLQQSHSKSNIDNGRNV